MTSFAASLLAFATMLADNTTSAVFDFREAAIQALAQRALLHTDPAAFVCVSINNRPPNVLQLLRLHAAIPRDLGAMTHCRCHDRDGYQICRYGHTTRPACRLNISEFHLETPRKGGATYLMSCGWPNGWGEIADLVKLGDEWGYSGRRGSILL